MTVVVGLESCQKRDCRSIHCVSNSGIDEHDGGFSGTFDD